MQPLIGGISVILRVVIGGIFAYSGWNKLSRPVEEFQYAIEAYQVFSNKLIVIAAHVVPWVELILGIFLIAGYFRRKTALGLSFLTATFIGLLVSTKLRGIELANCGCFGKGIHLTAIQAILVDCSLFIGLLFLSRCTVKILELDQLFKSDPHV